MNWTTKTGEEIPISQMTTSHIENCIKLMERSGNTQSLYCALTEEQLREMMRDPRYWRQREPEWVKRVTDGFRALVGGKKDE